METFDPQYPVSVTKVGQDDANRRVALLVPHDAPLQPFLEAIPDYAEACPNREHLPELAESQRDVGSLHIAEGIGIQLRNHRRDVQIVLIQGKTPRTIIDLNRRFNDKPGHPGNSIWYNFEFSEHQQLYQDLGAIHQRGLDAIRDVIFGTLKPGDVLMDIHTMGPYTPPVHLRPNPNNLGDIVELWRKKTYPDAERKIDFISHIQDDGEASATPMVDQTLVEDLQAEFFFDNLNFSSNEPYSGKSYLLSCELGLWARENHIPNVILDFPKHYFSVIPQGDMSAFDLCSLQLDPQKCRTLVRACVSAILRQLQKSDEMGIDSSARI